jgi:putative intracellular protease/amidase
MKALTILFIVTSHGMLGDTGHPTGVWLEELTTPYYALTDAGYTVEVASIKGGAVPVDPRSLEEETLPPSVQRYQKDDVLQKKLSSTPGIAAIDEKNYAAVFLPGGHGTMWDLPYNPRLAEIVSKTYEAGKPVAAVCHGPAGLVGVKLSDGNYLVNGKKIATFTNEEEEAVGLTEKVPFLLESKLKEQGAIVQKVENFKPFAVRDGLLITGQNPPSSEKVASLLMEALK